MTKTNIHKWVAILVSFLMIGTLFSMLPITNLTASAISCQKDGFDKSRYTLSGNMAEDVATIAKSQKGRTGAQFGYTEAWCDEFVADCIENAGADSSIVGHGGTVADFEAVMRKKGAVEVSSPQVGDLVFFTYSHVEIVTKVENGTVYCAGGNNGGTGNYKTNYCAGERKLYATARLYLRPNYKENPNPTWAKVTLNQNAYMVGENVTFNLSSDYGKIYTIGIDDANGNRIDTYDTKESSYTRTFNSPGQYSCYITTYTSSGYVDSERIYFEIYNEKPKDVSVSLSQNCYMVGENVTFNYSSKYGFGYTIGIDDANGNRIDTYDTKESSYTRTFDSPGQYSCYVTTYNGVGLTDSERIYFEIYNEKPKDVSVSLSQNCYMVGENVTFNYSSKYGFGYTIGIDDANGNRIDTYDTKESSYTRTFDSPGQYSCYVTTYNGVGLTDSERIYFEIYNEKPKDVSVSLSQNCYMVGENVTFNYSSKYGFGYTIGIDDANGNRIDTYDTKKSSYTRTFDSPGQYSCYITTYNGVGLTDSERIYFKIVDKCDINIDFSTNLNDVVFLQKILLRQTTFTADQAQLADYNGDGSINVLDLMLLKRALLAL